MQRRIETREYRASHQPRLAFTPVRTGNDFVRRHQLHGQAITIQEHLQGNSINAVDQEHRRAARQRYFKLVSRRMAIETRSRAICWRRMSASCSLASCRFSSKLKSLERLMVCGASNSLPSPRTLNVTV